MKRISYQPLASEKYLYESIKCEDQIIRQLRNSKAISDFSSFLVGLGAILVGIYIAQQTPNWFPYVETFLSHYGIKSA